MLCLELEGMGILIVGFGQCMGDCVFVALSLSFFFLLIYR